MAGELLHDGRLCPELERPAAIEPGDLFVVPHRVEGERVAELAAEKIERSFLRPSDIAGATVASPHLAYVPFWRVEVAVDGMHVSFPISIATGPKGPRIPVPLPGFRHRESVSLVMARKLFLFRRATSSGREVACSTRRRPTAGGAGSRSASKRWCRSPLTTEARSARRS